MASTSVATLPYARSKISGINVPFTSPGEMMGASVRIEKFKGTQASLTIVVEGGDFLCDSELNDLQPLTISARGALRGQVAVPGDKSISHRALMLSALAVGESRIEGLLESEDVLATAVALRAMGLEVVEL